MRSHRCNPNTARTEHVQHVERFLATRVDEVVGKEKRHLSDFVGVHHGGELSDVLAAETERHNVESFDPLSRDGVDGGYQIERGEVTLANQVQSLVGARQLAELLRRAFDAEHLFRSAAGCSGDESQLLAGIRPRVLCEAIRQQRVFAPYARRRLQREQRVVVVGFHRLASVQAFVRRTMNESVIHLRIWPTFPVSCHPKVRDVCFCIHKVDSSDSPERESRNAPTLALGDVRLQSTGEILTPPRCTICNTSFRRTQMPARNHHRRRGRVGWSGWRSP